MYHTLKRVDIIITMNVILLLIVALLLFVSRGYSIIVLWDIELWGYWPGGYLQAQIMIIIEHYVIMTLYKYRILLLLLQRRIF